jgi:hypothetical protein
MNFKQFFLERKEGPHHHSIKRLTSIGDGGIHKSDGSIKSLSMIAAVHKKKKDANLEAAKKGNRRYITNVEAAKHAHNAQSELSKLTPRGIRLNSAHAATLYFCPIRKQYYIE